MVRINILLIVLACLFAATGCTDPDDQQTRIDPPNGTKEQTPVEATAYGGEETLSDDQLERDRYDDSWRDAISLRDTMPRRSDTDSKMDRQDTGGGEAAAMPAKNATQTDTTSIVFVAGSNTEQLTDISKETVNADSMVVPLSGEVEGPSVLRVQILLDRSHFSPGIIDGRWGKNTEKAVYWIQHSAGMDATGTVDSTTYRLLRERAGIPAELIVTRTLTAEQVEGPFVEIPEDIYEKAKLDCMCYTSLSEKLAEEFHATQALLEQLNPGVTLDDLKAGDTINVPNVSTADDPSRGEVARLVVSDGGHFVHAVDSTGTILYHFPSTLGSSYDPSPSGSWKVNSITEDPWWHYQPSLLAHVDDSEEDARIPPGPNNAVGLVWIDLSKEHYGIHGTSAPETIGYVTSAGCVRLTNWDALFLGRHIEPGTAVEFQDTDGRGQPSS